MIFLDSSIIVAYIVDSDTNHEKSIEIIKNITDGKFGRMHISDYVFDETITTTFIRSKSLDKAIYVGEYLKMSTVILKVDDSDFEDAWELFKNQKSTKLSFTDCSIIKLMERYGINNLATFDKEFSKINGINVITGS